MAKTTLTNDDKRAIKDFELYYEESLEVLERSKQLSIGDYLVLYLDSEDSKKRLVTNSYGAPVKYKVVYATKHGIPFVKKVNKKGKPIGPLYSCVGLLETDDFRHVGQKFQFELDPDYADSILLQDHYDPATLHKSKREIWSAVTEHNKSNKIPTRDIGKLTQLFSAINIGDTLWTSNNSHYLVQDKKTFSRTDFMKTIKHKYPGSRIKGPFVIVLTVIDKKGTTIDITADFFYHKALYKERPRSYNELNI